MIEVKKAWEHQEIEKEKEAEALEGLKRFLEQSEAQGELPLYNSTSVSCLIIMTSRVISMGQFTEKWAHNIRTDATAFGF